MRFELATLLTHTCPNLWHDLVAAGRLEGAAVEVPEAQATAILARCNQPPQPVTATVAPSIALPLADWPFWARALRRRRLPTETGVGDTLERLISPLGAKPLAKAYERFAGKPCGCQDRKNWLNRRYPF